MSNQREPISICGAVFLIFLTMRLLGHIDWEWYWIAAPLWIPLAVCLGIAGVIFVLAFSGHSIAAILKARRTQEKK